MESLGLNKALIQTCHSLRIFQPTEIQARTIPLILDKKNVVGISETGSGKTACYCLPILHLLAQECYGIYTLVLLPTKELALQVFEQFRAFSAHFGWDTEIAWIVGGDKWITQSQTLSRRPFIVIATPGRLLQHLVLDDIRICFKNLHTLVLDEADYLLDGTLEKEVNEIITHLPPHVNRQTILFTATKSSVVSNFVKICDQSLPDHYKSKFFIDVNTSSDQKIALPNLEHYYIFIPSQVKLVYLVHLLLTTLKDQPGIIFTKTCRTAQIIATLLSLYDLPVTTIHGLLDHKRRSAHLAKFRGNISTLLVATDVAARGLDIPKVNFVVNFDFPRKTPLYIHRAGRTSRAGRKGITMSILCEKDDTSLVKPVESTIGQALEKFEVCEDTVLKRLSEVTRKYQEAKQILSESEFFDRAIATRNLKIKKKNLKGAKHEG